MDTSKSTNTEDQWVVDARVYSGRSNPSWPVDSEVMARIIEIWDKLPSRSESAPELPILGYQGLNIRNKQMSEEWHVYHEYVSRSVGHMREQRNDSDRDIERLLLTSAPENLLPPLNRW